jgi:hypothetical protein
MLNVLPFLPLSQNQPLKLADDWYMRILKNKIKAKDLSYEIKGTEKINLFTDYT